MILLDDARLASDLTPRNLYFYESRGFKAWDAIVQELRKPAQIPFSWRIINEDDADLPPFGVIRDAD